MFGLIQRVTQWFRRKTAPEAVRTSGMSSSFIDAYRQLRTPSALELLKELKNTAYACAMLNAGTCATYPPRLYVVTRNGDPSPKCVTRSLADHEQQAFANRSELQPHVKGARHVQEVLEHPLLTLLHAVNPMHSAHDLWELTTLDQEVQGSAYWLLESNALDVPETIWILPAHQVRPVREQGSTNIVDYYQVQSGSHRQQLSPSEVIHFRYPNPRDPYGPGLSPLRAAFEQVALSSEYLAYKRSLWNNNALPSVILSPAEVISDEERDRLEALWAQRFSRGGNGRVLVAESSLSVDLINQSLGDLATLAEAGATKEEIANSFGVPISYLTSQTNLANLQAAEEQYAARTIRPRLQRRDEKLNEQLIPRYDREGRLFIASDDPTPKNQEFQLRQQEIDLEWGVRTINEIRAERGLPPLA